MDPSSKSPKSLRNIILAIFIAIVLFVALYAWNCSDYTASSDSPTITLYGNADPRLNVYPEVKVGNVVPGKRFCFNYHVEAYLDNPGYVERKDNRYRAVIRVGGPRFALFCDWEVTRAALAAEIKGKGRWFVFSIWNLSAEPIPPRVKNVTCYTEKYSIDCDMLRLDLPEALKEDHELNIRLVDTPRPKD